MPRTIFRINWYAQKSFIAFSRLQAEQIGVLIQIINLIYIENGPVHYDAQFIGKNCNLTKGRAKRIIDELIALDEIYLTETGSISQRTCDLELSQTQIRMQEYSKNGRKAAKSRWENKENQSAKNANLIFQTMPSINNINSNINRNSIDTSFSDPSKTYDVNHHLNDDARQRAKANAPGWNPNKLIEIYNDEVTNGKTPRSPDVNNSYPAWCKIYTKGKPPN